MLQKINDKIFILQIHVLHILLIKWGFFNHLSITNNKIFHQMYILITRYTVVYVLVHLLN